MALKKIFSFLTYPGKNRTPANEVSGVEIPIGTDKLCSMLSSTYAAADKDCSINISFVGQGGNQKNAVREEILKIMNRPSVASALPLAKRLQTVTTGSSGMGLLFVCYGMEKGQKKIVIARFPADEGIVAERTAGNLTVQFVEQVFLKSAYSYKSALYTANQSGSDMWEGAAIDKQTSHSSKDIADYWISDFLLSEFKTTSAAGTKRLAVALKKAVANTQNPDVKHDIASAVRLAVNIKNAAMTIAEFCDVFHLSADSKAAVMQAVDPARLLHANFKFDPGEFARNIAYKLIELDNGAQLSAEVDKFDQCFETSVSDSKSNAYTFRTSGTIVNEKLKAHK